MSFAVIAIIAVVAVAAVAFGAYKLVTSKAAVADAEKVAASVAAVKAAATDVAKAVK